MMKIRRATIENIRNISKVVEKVWNQSIDFEVCRSQIESDTCAIWIATEEDDIAGFLSAFLTIDINQVRRWEVDLVAVRPTSQRQRRGQKLVEMTWADAKGHNVKMARAIVRINNIASQKTFERAGYTTNRRVSQAFFMAAQEFWKKDCLHSKCDSLTGGHSNLPRFVDRRTDFRKLI